MGKRIISQARGKGSKTYRVKPSAFKYRIKYPSIERGEGKVLKIFHSAAHSAPLIKVKFGKETFYNVAVKGLIEGQEINIGNDVKTGNIVSLSKIPTGTEICNIETRPFSGGNLIRSSGGSARITKKSEEGVLLCCLLKKKLN